ncbi:hypothetical protein LTR86_005220 [Recurvomyces mirabilis]|nr:hypothetical protein LTR86_005220 [Recurvomyces mirabilis]
MVDPITTVQTVSAVFDLLKLAYKAGVFLKKVSEADAIAKEVYERTERLSHVLEGVRAILQRRSENGPTTSEDGDSAVAERIAESVKGCSTFLHNLESRVAGFDTNGNSVRTLVHRFKVACRHPSIAKRQTDLEARISILQTDLVVLQLFDQAHTQTTINVNQSELLSVIERLGEQVQKGNELLQSMLHHEPVRGTMGQAAMGNPDTGSIEQPAADEVLSSLTDCLHAAENVYERYTSEHVPDNGSLVMQDRILTRSRPMSPLTPGTPESRPKDDTPSLTHRDSGLPDSMSMLSLNEPETHMIPLRILNRYIADHCERAVSELEKSHFNQAESCLDSAMRYSEAREQQHRVPFANRVKLTEDLAYVYMKQSKWATAVAKVHELLRETDEHGVDALSAQICNARQNQMLAATYFDRWQNSSPGALHAETDDLEMAERHAHMAFTKRDCLVEDSEVSIDEAERERHRDNMSLLVNILEARGKTVEATVWREMFSEGSTDGGESLRRASTLASRPPTDFEVIGRHDMLVAAIKGGDTEVIQNPMTFHDLSVDKVMGRGEGKTLLIHAVESSDETTLHRLLDQTVGADVDARNRRGRTALHFAAAQGRREIVRCLLAHDADIDAKDNDGETPLIKAVQSGHRDVIQDLCDHGANMLTRNLVRLDEWNALIHAVQLPTTKVATLLLDLAPELKDSVDQSGKTALHHCAEAEKLEHAKALLEHRQHLDVNAVDAASRSPLYFAASKPAKREREAMVNLLMDHAAVMDENKPPPRMREYAALKAVSAPRRSGRMQRHDSISTEGSIGTVSTSGTKLSRIFSNRMGFR